MLIFRKGQKTNSVINHTTPSPEQLAIDSGLSKAAETIADLSFDEDFQRYTVEHGIDPTDGDETDPLLYWQATRDFAASELTDHPGQTKLESQSLEVIAGLPLSLTQSYILEKQGRSLSYRERRPLKEGVSHYNKVLKDFISTHPQGSDELKAHLLDATLDTMGGDSHDFIAHAEKSIEAQLKGMKHEIAFAKVLDSLGVECDEGTVDDDLEGRDLIIEFGGRKIGIDVKASLSEVTAHDGDATTSPAVYDHEHDRFIIFSGFVEKDFRGTFDVPSALVAERAPMIGALLQKTILQSQVSLHLI